jgi:hypothetical protein
LLAINYVYPIFPSLVVDKANVPSLDDVKKKPEFKSTYEWSTGFLERRGTTLGQFLDSNGLALSELTMAENWPVYQMLPKTTTLVNGVVWDDTVFSKLVDDGALSGRAPDEAIRDARKHAASFLTTTERQNIVRAFALKHFKVKGYDGS